MSKLHAPLLDVKREYIYPIIEKKLELLQQTTHPDEIINLGIGDISLPLAKTIQQAICLAVEEMGDEQTLRGYPPGLGFAFLREKIAEVEYGDLRISPEEIFISDGINSDASNFQELFAHHASVGIPDPSYPVYLDVNLMAGRSKYIHILPCREDNGFIPQPPEVVLDFVYLCTPSNPMAVAMSRDDLKAWIDYAKKTGCILLIDNAYSAFVRSKDVPKSIYELEGAHEVAIEMRSFSKSAGFTGLRCAYSVVPKGLVGHIEGKEFSIHKLWSMRMATKSNGVAYPIQRGAEAALSEKGREETKTQVDHYLAETKRLKEGLLHLGHSVFGGLDAPYVWWKVPGGKTGWEFFDELLQKHQILSVPGSAFGKEGEHFVRLSGFTKKETVEKALKKIGKL